MGPALQDKLFSPPQEKHSREVVEMCLSDNGAHVSVQVRTCALNSHGFT